MSKLSELYAEFDKAQTHGDKLALYEAIKAEQVKQEQAAIAVMYPKGAK